MSTNREHGDDPNLTALALDQLDESERVEIERQITEAGGEGDQVVQQTRRLAGMVRETLAAESPQVSLALRETLMQRLDEVKGSAGKPVLAERPQSFWRRYATEFVAAALILALATLLFFPAGQWARSTNSASSMARVIDADDFDDDSAEQRTSAGREFRYQRVPDGEAADQPLTLNAEVASPTNPSGTQWHAPRPVLPGTSGGSAEALPYFAKEDQPAAPGGTQAGLPMFSFSNSDPKGTDTRLDQSGGGQANRSVQGGQAWEEGRALARGSGRGEQPKKLYEADMTLLAKGERGRTAAATESAGRSADPRAFGIVVGDADGDGFYGRNDAGLVTSTGSEQYAAIVENAFIPVQGIDALSTFSIDVDTASYANVRRFLTQGQLPPADAVRLEEMVNYFSYDYPQPQAGEPFSVNMEVAECPWQEEHLLLRVGLQGREIHHQERPVSNLVFLLDVSGSMADENKLPLLKQVLSMMVRELREDDRVSIVTYAGEAGLRLPPTTGNEQAKILAAIDSLSSGGSTNGSAGIELAYEQAQAYFRPEGTNRVILATDGDLNVGITDDESLVRLIKEKAASGVFLTVLGFGEGNLKDAKMERLADNGNGLYAYIDGVREGRKVLVEQMSGSLVTIAKDVKIQIEFNPREVQSYRLLGYENRMLTAPEFNDDRRDAGEIGAGHSVTALYELVPAGTQLSRQAEKPALRYQSVASGEKLEVAKPDARLSEAAASGELLTLKLRYKEPDGMASKLSEHALKSRGGKFNAASKDFQFAAAVAAFGMHLRNSQYRGQGDLSAAAEIAAASIGADKGGYRAEFVDLVRKAQSLGVK